VACITAVAESWCRSGSTSTWRRPRETSLGGRFFLAVDLTQRHPFADASFDLGYAEDFLEHLSQAQSLIFLSEAYRTLRSGGVLRLSFPGLEGVLRKHYLGGSAAALAHPQRDAYESWGHVHFIPATSFALWRATSASRK
jgi:SAM-dependent methyltransferase